MADILKSRISDAPNRKGYPVYCYRRDKYPRLLRNTHSLAAHTHCRRTPHRTAHRLHSSVNTTTTCTY